MTSEQIKAALAALPPAERLSVIQGAINTAPAAPPPPPPVPTLEDIRPGMSPEEEKRVREHLVKLIRGL